VSREIAVARCRTCGTVRPVIRCFNRYETVCSHCGHVCHVKDEDMKWVPEDRWPLAAALIGTRPTAFVTRETAPAPLVETDLWDQGAPWH